MSDRPAIVPSVFYKDPIAAIRWLEQAFGFETTSLVVDAEGRLGHSELEFRGAPLSVGAEWSGPPIAPAAMKSPQSLGGVGTQFLRLSVPDGLEALCERARAAGARIVQEPQDQFYGERTFRVLDPEGHVWNFGQAVAQPTVADMEQATGLRFHKSLAEVGHG
jgi:uncharacterized glyoxalase superfamily protein PhnB